MRIDRELISNVQRIANGETIHRASSLIACYVNLVGLLDESPELRERAVAVETALRTLCATGRLPRLTAQMGP